MNDLPSIWGCGCGRAPVRGKVVGSGWTAGGLKLVCQGHSFVQYTYCHVQTMVWGSGDTMSWKCLGCGKEKANSDTVGPLNGKLPRVP